MKHLLFILASIVALVQNVSAQLTKQQQIQKLNLVYQQIRSIYVDDVDLEPLVEEAIRATLAELDPHSTYLTKEEMAAARDRLQGEFAGIGIRYIMHNDTLTVRYVMDNSPAQRADIRPNDRIVAVDNSSIVALDEQSVAELLKGSPNSKVRLQVVRRNNVENIDIRLRRDFIDTSAISAAYRIGDVGYIAISSFSKPAASEFYSAFKTLGDVEAIVVDLRNNGGGSMTAAIDLTSRFLKKGEVIMYNEYRNREECITKKREDGALSDIPIVVIINESSASASEIFAGAIQDQDRGVIMGHTSYGKGLVQRMIDLDDGSGFTLTIARYKTPSGRIIQRPYSMGERDIYYGDVARYMHPDSIERDDLPQYKTLKNGRTIYGGGGITPDIYIDTNHIRLSECVATSTQNAVFEHSVIDFWDIVEPQMIILNYPTMEVFNSSYELDVRLLDIFYQRAGYTLEDISELDKEYIHTLLMATMAELLYGNNARYYIYGVGFDYVEQQAINIAANRLEYNSILSGVENKFGDL